jgi:hypothetical protein
MHGRAFLKICGKVFYPFRSQKTRMNDKFSYMGSTYVEHKCVLFYPLVPAERLHANL